MSTAPDIIAGPLPAHPKTGWAREDVWIEDTGSFGDWAVGRSFSARYRRDDLVIDDEWYVEAHPSPESPEHYAIVNRVGYGRVRDGEVEIEDYTYDDGALWYPTIEAAGTACREAACGDWRDCYLWTGGPVAA